MELPLGATEDRICGTINIEKALQEGIKAYEPGLLVRYGISCDLANTSRRLPASHGSKLSPPWKGHLCTCASRHASSGAGPATGLESAKGPGSHRGPCAPAVCTQSASALGSPHPQAGHSVCSRLKEGLRNPRTTTPITLEPYQP